MTEPGAKPEAPKPPSTLDDDEDSNVSRGFYEHSTGGKIPVVPQRAPAQPERRPGVAAAIARAVRSVFKR